MSEVTLRAYCEEIEALVDEGALDAAISHCQHMLKVHPKYFKAYGLLAKAALEKGEMKVASDLFSRVLSIDPEDFVARVGMSIASDQDGTLDQAVWHMERALELAADNQAIAGELRRLYGRRDGREPDKIPLTQGALARLYARGNLYSQAIHEFRHLLQAEPDRVDLQVALAETLWRADQRIEAAETSLAILEKLPYCLKANLILGEIWSRSGRKDEGAAHLKRAQMIDPESETAQALFGARSPLPPVEVRIAHLEYVAPPPPTEQEPDWLAAIIQEGAAPAATDEAVPDWLQAVAAAADVEAAPPEEVTPPEAAPVPDWLRDVAATAGVEAEEFATAPEMADLPSAEEEVPDWLAELTAGLPDVAAQPLAPEEIPGWLQEAELSTAEEAEPAPGEVPDWLAEMAAAAEEPEPAPGEVSDWLAEMALAAEEPELAPGAELPDWLTEMASLEELPSDTGEEELAPADIPDWLAEMAPPEAAPQVVAEMDLSPAEVPDWLAEAPAEEPVEEAAEAVPPPLVAAETPDWLAELAEAADLSMEEAPADQPFELEEEEIPDWLAELREEQAPAIPVPEELVGVEREPLVYPEGAGGEVTEAEAELLARLEEMSPEEAFAAWEALLAESEVAEAAVPEAEEAQPEVEVAAPMEVEELAALELEPLVYPEGAGGEVTEAEAELLARLEEMSPEEAFAAWEALLAESEAAEAAVPGAEETQPEMEAARPMEAEAPAVPEPEPLPYPEEPEAKVAPAEAELIAGLEEMSPEEAFAAWEAMLAEGALQEQVLEEAEPAVEPVAEADQAWMALGEDEGPLAETLEPEPAVAAVEAGPVPEAEAAPEVAHTWVSLTEEEEWEEVGVPGVSEEMPLAEPVAELDQPWMALAADEEQAEVTAPPHEPPVEEEEAVELPDWAVVEAAELAFGVGPGAEEEITLGPDWVWLSAEEEAEIRTAESFEEAALRAEVPFAAPSVQPTWVAAEEEAPAVVPVPEAPSAAGRVAEARQRVAADEEDDWARLELARSLWAAGQKDEAQGEYERLIKSALLEDVTADLEGITTEAPSETPILRLLGDAYMRDNRLREALDTYRRALSSL